MQPATTGSPLRRLLPFLRPSRGDLGIALAASVAGQVAVGITPLVQKVIVDDVIVEHRRDALPWLVALAACAVGSFGLAVLRRWYGGRVAFTTQHLLRVAVFERLMRLDFAGHDRLRTGQLVSRSSSDLGLIQQLLSTTPLLLGNLVLLVVSLVSMTLLSPPLTLVTAATLPVLGVLAYRLRRVVFPATWHAQQRAAEVAGVVDEAVSGVRIVKGFGAEQRETARLAAVAERLYASRVRLLRLQSRSVAALSAVPAFAQVGVLAFGGWLAMQGRLSLGTFLAFASYLVPLASAMRFSASIVANAAQARAGAARLLDVLDANAEVVEEPGAPPLHTPRGEVRFEGVTFGYQRSQPVLDGFDLTVAPGEVVALVGASGSGKSTVAALLPRFYDVAAGRVLIDGVDVRHVQLASLRSAVGVAFEEAFLFSDTISANIAYGRPDASDAEVRAAARTAGASGFIEALPHGYATVVGERGMTLSGGQRQRIALARAVLRDPRILVLDAATSAVDTATEAAIHAALADVLAGRTTILIAHRASTVRLADRVVLVEHGRVTDQGTHEELLARNAAYRALIGGAEPQREPSPAAGPSPIAGGVNGASVAGADGVIGADRVTGADGGVTPAAWPDGRDDAPVPYRSVGGSALARSSGGPGAGRGGGGGVELVATPALLAVLDRLPPADDRSEVDPAAAAAEPPERFRVARFVRPWRRRLLFGLALVAADAVLTLAGPVLIRHAIDDGIRVGRSDVLWWSAAVFLVVTTADWAVTRAGAVVTGRTAEAMLCSLRIRIFAHLQRLSLDYYDSEMDGRIMTRMTSDVEALSQLVQTGLVNAVVGAASCLGVAVCLTVMSPPLALAAACVLPPLAAATWWYQRRSSQAYGASREAIAEVNANLQENLSGVRVAQAYDGEGRSGARFAHLSDTYRTARLRAQLVLSLYFPGIGLLSDLGAIAVLAVGIRMVGDGSTTPAVVIAFLLYLNLFFSPIQQLSQVFDTWQQAAASTVKITELLTTDSRTPAPASPRAIGRLRGEISFERTSFRYPGATDDALRELTLRIAPGETVALVGETGAGKSTVVRLIARFHDPTEGSVRVDGIDLREIDLDAYRHQLGIVPQEPFLFTGTVRDNIAYGRPDASDAEVEAAARDVGAHPFIASLPSGYRSEVSERGRSLSAGQRQLIALARAQLVRPAVLLLDEATANLDQRAEAQVRQAMERVAARSTTVLVAHRLATACTADRIAVLADGRLVEIGPHDELLARGGTYAELWAANGGSGPSTLDMPSGMAAD